MCQLVLQVRKEALCHGVVVAVSLPAHTWTDLVVTQVIAKHGGGKLRALIRMADQPAGRLLLFDTSLQSCHGQLGCLARCSGPSGDAMRAQVDESSKMQRAFPCCDLCHVADP